MNLLKNLKTKVYLGLILVLVSTQAHASLETWGLKNDLIIPSLETQSISVLDSKAKREIMMGYECCWDRKHIEAVQREHFLKSIEYSSRVNQKKLEFSLHSPATKTQYAIFIALQLADIYSTYQGLKYTCVKELNPIIGDNPSYQRMFWTKAVVLTPAFKDDHSNGRIDKPLMHKVNAFQTMIVAQNMNVYKKAKNNCTRRG